MIIVYLASSGQITRCISCPEGMEEIQCNPDEDWIEHPAVDDTEWKINPETKQLEPISLN